MTTKQLIKFLEHHFKVTEEQDMIQLETWTDGGVNMFVTLWKNVDISLVKQFWNFAHYDFDIDEEIDIHRLDERYCNAFRISQSLKDFGDYQDFLIEIAQDLQQCEKGGIH